MQPGEKLWYEDDAELMKELHPSQRTLLKSTRVDPSLAAYIEREGLGRRKPSQLRRLRAAQKQHAEHPLPDAADDFATRVRQNAEGAGRLPSA